MIRILVTLNMLMLLAHTAQAANLRMCTDEEGNKTFTQGNCPKNTTRQVIEVEPAQSPVTAIRAKEKQMLIKARDKRRAQIRSEKDSKKKKTKKVKKRCNKSR